MMTKLIAALVAKVAPELGRALAEEGWRILYRRAKRRQAEREAGKTKEGAGT